MNILKINKKKLDSFFVAKHGFIPMLYYLNWLVSEEQYETCELIKDALNKSNTELNLNLPIILEFSEITTLFADAFEEKGMSGITALINLPHYIQAIHEELTQ